MHKILPHARRDAAAKWHDVDGNLQQRVIDAHGAGMRMNLFLSGS